MKIPENLNFEYMIQSLKFNESFDSSSVLIGAHLKKVEQMLADYITEETMLTPHDKQKIASLPQQSLVRLIASPYICEFLMLLKDGGGEDTQRLPMRMQLIQGIIAEILVEDPSYDHRLKPAWTINGDVVLDSGIAEKFPSLATDCGISLNYQSFVHNTGRDGIGGYDYSTALKHKERIETGKNIIKSVSASAISLVDNFTTIIQFRQNKNRPNVVNSSTHSSIGLIRCDNFHKLHRDMPEIVDMLVHESIHQYLHLFEEQIADFVNVNILPKEILNQRLFPSPWSGNLLDIRSYTHAILVWWGLSHFWEQYVNGGFRHPEVTTVQAQKKMSEAFYGFENSCSVLDNLGADKKYLNVEYSKLIVELQASFKSRVAV